MRTPRNRNSIAQLMNFNSPEDKKTQQKRKLELHEMWSVTLGQTEGGGKVAREVWDGLDVLEESRIDSILVVLAVIGEFLLHWLSLSIEEFLLLGLLGALLFGEVLVVKLIQTLNTGEIDLGRSGDDVSGVDSAEWDTVDLERSAYEEEAVVKWLEVDNTLSTVSTSEDDEDGTRLKRRTEVGWSLCLAGLLELWGVLSWLPFVGLVHWDLP